MAFFKDPEVEKKYRNTNGEANPKVRVAIQYVGPLSDVPMVIADKIFNDGGHIEIKKEERTPYIKPEKIVS